jgi:hypothetical protein
MTHSLLISAGLNWHLFDTIDIKRYPSNEVVHLPTSLMVGYEPNIVHCEEVDIPGIPKPNLDSMVSVTCGVMMPESIGYIYAWTWTWNSSVEFQEACSTLVSMDHLKGIIIDYRYNEGGNTANSKAGMYWLYDDTTLVATACQRYDPYDRLAMMPVFSIGTNGNGIGYRKPIAVLLGPGCYSAGDYVAYQMTVCHTGPLRTFGRPTCGAHIANQTSPYIHPDWTCWYANGESRKYDSSSYYLTHRGFEPDTFVWHTRDAIAEGRDAVVEAAMYWIHPDAVAEAPLRVPSARVSGPAIVRGALRMPEKEGGALLDVSGRRIHDLEPGLNDIRHVAPGVYFVRQLVSKRTAKVVVTR